MNRKILGIILIGIAVLVGGAVILQSIYNDSGKPKTEETVILPETEKPVESIKPEIKTVEITEGPARININIKYPEFHNLASSTLEANLNKILKDKFEAEAIKFKADAEKDAVPELSVSSSLDVVYETILFNENAVSLKFNHSEFIAGMAHPNSYYSVFNYDLKNGKEVVLSDMFNPKSNYLATLSTIAANDLKTQLTKEDYYDKNSVKEGTKPKAQNFSLFVFDDKKISFIFNTPQVAPYVAGTRFVDMSYSDLAELNDKSEFLKQIISALPVTDGISDELSRLKDETGVVFGDIIDSAFNWMAKDGDGMKTEILDGEKLSGENLLKADYDKIVKFFADSGYQEDANNAADGVRGTQSGYQKDGNACVLSSVFMEMTVDDSGISVPASDKRKIEIICGKSN